LTCISQLGFFDGLNWLIVVKLNIKLIN